MEQEGKGQNGRKNGKNNYTTIAILPSTKKEFDDLLGKINSQDQRLKNLIFLAVRRLESISQGTKLEPNLREKELLARYVNAHSKDE